MSAFALPSPLRSTLLARLARGQASAGGAKVAGAAAFDLVLLTDRTQFDALESEWNELFERSGTSTQVFQTFNWCWHWANHYLDREPPGRFRSTSLAVITARRDGRLVMVWPLTIERIANLKRVCWLGEPVSQYGDVLIEDTPDRLAMLRAGWALLLRRTKPDVVSLRKVRSDACVAPLLKELGARASNPTQAPYLDLTNAASFEDYEQRYGATSRKNRKRKKRRLEELGRTEFAAHSAGPEAGRLAVQGLDIKRQWAKERGLVSRALSDDRTRAFFQSVAGDTARPTGARTCCILIDGKPAAVEVAFVCKGRSAMHLTVYDSQYEKVSPGQLMFEYTAKQAYAEGLHTIDLLAPADGYKLDWADKTVAVDDFALPLSFLGYAEARMMSFARVYGKKLIAAMPDSIRKLAASWVAVTPMV